MPKISVIVPVYNTEKYLEQCVDSILNQTYSNIEVILVDDGSTDSSGKICDAYREKDSRVIVVHKENGGLSSSRKAGIEKANGKYLTMVDADDWIDQDAIKECTELAQKNDAECILFSYVREYTNGSFPVQVLSSNYGADIELHRSVYKQLFGLTGKALANPEKGDSIVSCCMKLYELSSAKHGRFFDTKEVGSCEDALFNIHALHGCKKIYYIDRPFYHYRRTNSESLTSQYKPNLFYQWKCLFAHMQEAIDEYQLDKEYSEALSNRIAMQIIGLGFEELDNPDKHKRIANIRIYLNDPEYVKACKALEIKYMPVVWKVFFTLCKCRCAVGVFLLLSMASKLKGKV